LKKLLSASAFILWPVFALGQSTLNFPRLFTQQDRQSTGFAIVNPGTTDAVVTFTLYGADGATVATATRTIPRGGQFAQLGSELFGATTSGWVQMTSNASGLQGFWIGGDFVNLTRADGATSAALSMDQVFPYVPTVATQLHIANPNGFAISITIRAFSDSGGEVGTHTRLVAAKAVVQLEVSSIVPTGGIAYMRVSGTSLFASLTVLQGTSSADNAVQNGLDASTLATTLVFPHFIDGALANYDYQSIITVVNLSTRVVNIHFQFSFESGGASLDSPDFALLPQSTIKGTATDFFVFPQFGFRTGYVKVTADGPIAGVVDYGALPDGGEAVVPAQVIPQTSLLFAHIADLSPWYTGLALQNPSNSVANIEVFAMNPNGTLIGGAANVPTARLTLAAGGKTAKLLSELIPQTQTRSGDGGFVFIRTTNGVPIHAIQLLFTRNLKILANISALPLPAGFTYTPPNP
jgi:hypothetical protein